MSQTVVTIDVGGTGANTAAGALISLGAAPAISFDQSNTAVVTANIANTQATTANTQANFARAQANAAYNAANNRVLKAGDTMTGNLNVAATLITQNVIPNANITYDLGTSTARFKDLWLSNSTIHLGEATISSNGGALVVPAMETTTGMNLEAEISAAYSQANAAYAEANLKLNISGGTIDGSLNVSGNLTITGNTKYVNVDTYIVTDPLIYLAANNEMSDLVDIGFMGGKNTNETYSHTGLVRDATDGKWKLFDGLAEEGHANNVVDFANTYLATLVANVEANTLTVVNGISGNVNFDSGTLFINSAGNRVGIRTTNPDEMLTIGSTADNYSGLAMHAFTEPQFYQYHNIGYSVLYNSYGDVGLFATLNGDGKSLSSNILYFKGYNDTANAYLQLFGNKMHIAGGGNVGIGTTSPASKLHIHGNTQAWSTSPTIIMSSSSTANTNIRNWRIGPADTYFGNFHIGASDTQGGIVDSNAEAATFTISYDGKVGIGTDNPFSPLHVRSTDDEGIRLDVTDNTWNYIGFSWSGTRRAYFGLNSSGFPEWGSDSSSYPIVLIGADVRPGADNSQNLGTASYRWANIYTADLNLSNRDSQNDVDGTWGEWTIQEGEEDLYLLNRRNGKKFKFVLKEIE